MRRATPTALALAMAMTVVTLSIHGEGAGQDRTGPADAPITPAACGADDVVPPLNGQPYQWKAGKHVGVWVDGTGTVARGAHRNSKPMVTLTARDAQSIVEGVSQWSGIPDAGVTFGPVTDNSSHDASYWFTVTWPAADVTFRASDGNLKTLTCQVPPASLHAAAYTCAFEDQVQGVSQSHTIAGAITMINTAHTFINPRDGNSYSTWVYRGTGWQSALVKLGGHETGHLMGLADARSIDPDGRQRPHVMKPFNGSNDTAPFGGAPRVGPVTACDRATVLTHPARQYQRWICAGPGAVPPPPCEEDEVPICRDPASTFPAPIWVCSVPGR